MGWFDEQIRERITYDSKEMKKSYQRLASVVDNSLAKDNAAEGVHNALDEICNYFGVERKKIPARLKTLDDQLDFLFRSAGLMWRRVHLEGEWWKDLEGPLLAETKEGEMVALLPGSTGKHSYFTHSNGVKVPLNKETAQNIESEALVFYEPLPQRPLTYADLLSFLNKTFYRLDLTMIGVLGFLIVLVGFITPYVTEILFETVVPTGRSIFLITFGVLLVGAALTTFLLNALKGTYVNKIQQIMTRKLKSAMFSRILSLPVEFFKKYRSGDLGTRIMAMDQLAQIYVQVVIGTGLTTLISLVYVFQIFAIAPVLAVPALIALALQIITGALSVYANIKVMKNTLDTSAKLDGLVYSVFSGIQKIKLAGAEKRAFNRWSKLYKEKADASFNPPFMLKLATALSASVSILGYFFIYSAAAGNVDLPQFVAFNSVYALVSGAFLSLLQSVSQLSAVKPILELNKPILEAAPEVEEHKEEVNRVNGNIELNNVSFKYREDGPNILDNLNLKINRGQYVAIVGKTGCGKSTLLRLLLGFETPQKGAIYIDGKDIQKVDKRSLRKKIGVVMQNGSLFSQSIFENIAISAPSLTLKEAWEAAEIAGLKEDIEDMPMGMNTILSEGGGGISGGQKQRLLIARAIAPKPRVLMLDEATSALDNLTQKQVSDALAKMNCTRIVIAHRLSTIKECDRIIVLDQGKIIEDGTYEELIGKGGFFADLVERQRIPENHLDFPGPAETAESTDKNVAVADQQRDQGKMTGKDTKKGGN